MNGMHIPDICPLWVVESIQGLAPPLHASLGLRLNNVSTTVSSAMVETSPRSWSPTAILRSTRRIILPERVLGRPGASCTKSGWANGPICFLTAHKQQGEMYA